MDKTSRVLLPLLLASGNVLADDAALRQCRGIAEPAARLACYDAMVPASLPSPSAQPPVVPIHRTQLAPPEQAFGRDRLVAPVLEAIESHIPGVFEGWQPRTRIRLANGQVWQVTDNSAGSYRLVDPKVRVRRGTLGSFFLELVNENRALRVKRVE